jgi:hypothetical protein
VEPDYEVDLFEDDYLFLLPVADLRMDPALRSRPVSSVAFAYLGNALHLNHSIERRHIYSPSVFRCDARLITQIGFVFRFYVYSGTFGNSPGYFFFCLRVEQFLALYALMGFFGFVGTIGVLSAPISDFVVWDGGLSFSGIS